MIIPPKDDRMARSWNPLAWMWRLFLTSVCWLCQHISRDPFKFAEALCAIVIAVTAVVGYFFTVVPIYSKAVLEEDKARLEQSVALLRNQSNDLQTERQLLEAERQNAQSEILRLGEQVRTLETEYATQRSEMDRQKAEMAAATMRSVDLIDRLDQDRRRIEAETQTLRKNLLEYSAANRNYVIDQFLQRIFSAASAYADGPTKFFSTWGFYRDLPSPRPRQAGQPTDARATDPSKFYAPHVQTRDFGGALLRFHPDGRSIIEDALRGPEFQLLEKAESDALISRIQRLVAEYPDQSAFTSLLIFTSGVLDFKPPSNDPSIRAREVEEALKKRREEARRHYEAHEKFVAAVEHLKSTLKQ